MKETRLGEFEEVLLLLVGILKEEAYAYNIVSAFYEQTGRKVSIGAVHSTLHRLTEKGFLTSELGAATEKRGGRRKRIYVITAIGHRALETSRELKLALWNKYPAFSG